MRFLILGAGALGGYFGGRLAEAGEDVSFLLRPKRAEQIARNGLRIKSPRGDYHCAHPACVQAESVRPEFDVIILGCKAYDLDSSIRAISPAMGPQTAVLPLLNGMRHLDTLVQAFGAERVLGGLCQISAALDADGTIEHFSNWHNLIFGELGGGISPRVETLDAVFAKCRFDSRSSPVILQDVWEKWVLIASLAGSTCLMRGPICDILQAGGEDIALQLLNECCQIAAANGHALRPDPLERAHSVLTARDSLMTASMFKDIERGAATEGEHILGEMFRKGGEDRTRHPLLHIAYTHLKTYEAKRARESTGH